MLNTELDKDFDVLNMPNILRNAKVCVYIVRALVSLIILTSPVIRIGCAYISLVTNYIRPANLLGLRVCTC